MQLPLASHVASQLKQSTFKDAALHCCNAVTCNAQLMLGVEQRMYATDCMTMLSIEVCSTATSPGTALQNTRHLQFECA